MKKAEKVEFVIETLERLYPETPVPLKAPPAGVAVKAVIDSVFVEKNFKKKIEDMEVN